MQGRLRRSSSFTGCPARLLLGRNESAAGSRRVNEVLGEKGGDRIERARRSAGGPERRFSQRIAAGSAEGARAAGTRGPLRRLARGGFERKPAERVCNRVSRNGVGPWKLRNPSGVGQSFRGASAPRGTASPGKNCRSRPGGLSREPHHRAACGIASRVVGSHWEERTIERSYPRRKHGKATRVFPRTRGIGCGGTCAGLGA
jgi:hypothetical protein